jgi:hypothetical protein
VPLQPRPTSAAGRPDFLFTSYISIGEQAKAGKLRIVAIGGPKRIDAEPDPDHGTGFSARDSSCGTAWRRWPALLP